MYEMNCPCRSDGANASTHANVDGKTSPIPRPNRSTGSTAPIAVPTAVAIPNPAVQRTNAVNTSVDRPAYRSNRSYAIAEIPPAAPFAAR